MGGSVPRALVQVRLDGKTVRGAKDADGEQLHLLAALAGPAGDGAAAVVAQSEVEGAKTNEPAAARDVLGRLDLQGKTITADALHTLKATAELIYQRGGQFVLPVKQNPRALSDALDRLAWNRTPIAHSTIDIGHVRITRRTIRVLPAPVDLPFPHVNQVWLIDATSPTPPARTSRRSPSSAWPATPPPRPATAEVAGYAQGQWAIEVLHWLRDTCYREDNSTVRTRSGPRVLATLRNLAIGALRLAGRRDITEATRWACRQMSRPFIILGLTS